MPADAREHLLSQVARQYERWSIRLEQRNEHAGTRSYVEDRGTGLQFGCRDYQPQAVHDACWLGNIEHVRQGIEILALVGGNACFCFWQAVALEHFALIMATALTTD